MPKRKANEEEPEGVDDRSKSVAELALWERRSDNLLTTATSAVFDTQKNSMDPDEPATTLQYPLCLKLYNGTKMNRTAIVRVHFVAPPKRSCIICWEAKMGDSCVPLKSAVDKKKHQYHYHCHHQHYHYDQVCAHPDSICSECMAKQSTCPFCRKPFECFAVFKAGEKSSVVLQSFGGRAFETQSLAKIFLQETEMETLDVLSLHGIVNMLVNRNSAQKDIWKLRYAGMLSMEGSIVELANNRPLLHVVRNQEKKIKQKLERFQKAMAEDPIQNYDDIQSDFEFLASIYGYTMEKVREFDAKNLFKWRQVFPNVWNIINRLQMSLDRYSFQEQ